MIKNLRVKQGFTLVELLVTMSILAIMVSIVVGTLNPIALVNKARDSRRKNDLNKIKIAFEAYHTDKGTYPTDEEVSTWNVEANCDKTITQMGTYLKTLPCDPNKKPYEIEIINDITPKSFKVITNLENKKDVNIPENWYIDTNRYGYRDRKDEINYGVSSSDILWYDYSGIDPVCAGNCMSATVGGGSNCVWLENGSCVSGGPTLCFIGYCTGTNMGTVFSGIGPTPQCYVNSCCNGSGCD